MQGGETEEGGLDPVNVWFSIFETLFTGAHRPDSPYSDCTNMQAAEQRVKAYTSFLEDRLPLGLSGRLGRPLFNDDPQTFQGLIDMALEVTLPAVLQELRGEYETLNRVENADDDSGDRIAGIHVTCQVAIMVFGSSLQGCSSAGSCR